jgi:hypothetical protein
MPLLEGCLHINANGYSLVQLFIIVSYYDLLEQQKFILPVLVCLPVSCITQLQAFPLPHIVVLRINAVKI